MDTPPEKLGSHKPCALMETVAPWKFGESIIYDMNEESLGRKSLQGSILRFQSSRRKLRIVVSIQTSNIPTFSRKAWSFLGGCVGKVLLFP